MHTSSADARKARERRLTRESWRFYRDLGEEHGSVSGAFGACSRRTVRYSPHLERALNVELLPARGSAWSVVSSWRTGVRTDVGHTDETHRHVVRGPAEHSLLLYDDLLRRHGCCSASCCCKGRGAREGAEERGRGETAVAEEGERREDQRGVVVEASGWREQAGGCDEDEVYGRASACVRALRLRYGSSKKSNSGSVLAHAEASSKKYTSLPCAGTGTDSRRFRN